MHFMQLPKMKSQPKLRTNGVTVKVRGCKAPFRRVGSLEIRCVKIIAMAFPQNVVDKLHQPFFYTTKPTGGPGTGFGIIPGL